MIGISPFQEPLPINFRQKSFSPDSNGFFYYIGAATTITKH